MKVWRQVECPNCGHIFMTTFHKDKFQYYLMEGTNKIGLNFDECTKCKEDLLVRDGILRGLKYSKYQKALICGEIWIE